MAEKLFLDTCKLFLYTCKLFLYIGKLAGKAEKKEIPKCESNCILGFWYFYIGIAAALCTGVQVCDATYDAMKYKCRAQKKYIRVQKLMAYCTCG